VADEFALLHDDGIERKPKEGSRGPPIPQSLLQQSLGYLNESLMTLNPVKIGVWHPMSTRSLGSRKWMKLLLQVIFRSHLG